MRRALLAAVLLALWAGTASSGAKLWTRHGVLEVVRGGLFDRLDLGGRPIFDPQGSEPDVRLDLRQSWQSGPDDVVLIGSWAGGNDVCANFYRFLTVTSDGTALTAPFAQCSGSVIAARIEGSGIELDLRSSDPRNDHISVIFEGGTVTEAAIPMQEVPAPIPGGGEAVTRWEGHAPIEVLQDPGKRVRFLAIMARPKLFDLMDRVAVSTGMRLREGWIVATGCMAHQCGAEMGGFALEVASGRAEALLYHDKAAPEVFGAELGSLHPALQDLARTGRLE